MRFKSRVKEVLLKDGTYIRMTEYHQKRRLGSIFRGRNVVCIILLNVPKKKVF